MSRKCISRNISDLPKIPALAAYKQAWHGFVGYAKRILKCRNLLKTLAFSWVQISPNSAHLTQYLTLFKKQFNTQEYRSGHNEAVLKTVCPKGTGVRIPLPAPKMKHQSLRLVLLFLLRYEWILTPLCGSPSRRMGFAFERKPSGSSLTSAGAINLRHTRIPLFFYKILKI